MIDSKFLDELAKKVSQAVPTSVKDIQEDFERNIRAILKSAFTKLDLVTREEFDAQVKVLARTRAKLTKLEKQVAELQKSRDKD